MVSLCVSIHFILFYFSLQHANTLFHSPFHSIWSSFGCTNRLYNELNIYTLEQTNNNNSQFGWILHSLLLMLLVAVVVIALCPFHKTLTLTTTCVYNTITNDFSVWILFICFAHAYMQSIECTITLFHIHMSVVHTYNISCVLFSPFRCVYRVHVLADVRVCIHLIFFSFVRSSSSSALFSFVVSHPFSLFVSFIRLCMCVFFCFCK